MTPLTEHFTLEELCFSEVALRRGLGNTPGATAQSNLKALAIALLEPARGRLAVPLHVNSGFRSEAVNAAVGGSPASAHLFGRAADLVPIGMDLREAFDELRGSALPYDQIIFECNAWLHLAIAPMGASARRQALLASGGPGRWTYHAA